MHRDHLRDRGPGRAPGTQVVLREGRDKPLRQRHPWVFSGAVHTIGDGIGDGGIADIVARGGSFLARGTVNRHSQIVARVLTFSEDEPIDDAFWTSRIDRALRARPSSGAARLVHAESDGLPGLVVDRYGEFCVLQASTLGMERCKANIVRVLERLAGPRGIYDRSDVDGRDKEALLPHTGVLWGEEPPDLVEITERTVASRDATSLVDVRHGHKTGAYLDQAENRRIVADYARGAELLNLFSYTGAFSLHAVIAGAARALNVDSSADALALSERISSHNGVSDRIEHLRADAFEVLRRFREEGRSFDVVIIDPPKFAHSAGQVEKAARAYKDLNRVAMHIIRPGGHLATFSCSGAISSELFQKIVWSASLEAGREGRIVRRLTQASDHPVALGFPEGEYLKGLVCRIG